MAMSTSLPPTSRASAWRSGLRDGPPASARISSTRSTTCGAAAPPYGSRKKIGLSRKAAWSSSQRGLSTTFTASKKTFACWSSGRRPLHRRVLLLSPQAELFDQRDDDLGRILLDEVLRIRKLVHGAMGKKGAEAGNRDMRPDPAVLHAFDHHRRHSGLAELV